jgi:hypothetical protein
MLLLKLLKELSSQKAHYGHDGDEQQMSAILPLNQSVTPVIQPAGQSTLKTNPSSSSLTT